MNSTKKMARAAGLLYLFMAITGAFGVLYIPSTLIVPANAAATATNILGSEMLFRVGIVSELVAAVLFIFLVVLLYRLFSAVNRTHASLMVILALVSVAIAFLIVLNEIAALALFRGADFLSVLDKPQRDAMAMLFLDLHRYGFVINGIFWGLWLFPFGILVMRSGFLPRILGVLLIIACFSYLAGSLTGLLLPGYASVVGRITTIPEGIGELSIMFWLLIAGAKDQPLGASA
jgi:uncharacterized protein DUF4386